VTVQLTPTSARLGMLRYTPFEGVYFEYRRPNNVEWSPVSPLTSLVGPMGGAYMRQDAACSSGRCMRNADANATQQGLSLFKKKRKMLMVCRPTPDLGRQTDLNSVGDIQPSCTCMLSQDTETWTVGDADMQCAFNLC
jgi:hypothetical protein